MRFVTNKVMRNIVTKKKLMKKCDKKFMTREICDKNKFEQQRL